MWRSRVGDERNWTVEGEDMGRPRVSGLRVWHYGILGMNGRRGGTCVFCAVVTVGLIAIRSVCLYILVGVALFYSSETRARKWIGTREVEVVVSD